EALLAREVSGPSLLVGVVTADERGHLHPVDALVERNVRGRIARRRELRLAAVDAGRTVRRAVGEVGVQDGVHRLTARGAIGAAILHALVIAVLAVVLRDLEVLFARRRARFRGDVGVMEAGLRIGGRSGRIRCWTRLRTVAEVLPALLEQRASQLAR